MAKEFGEGLAEGNVADLFWKGIVLANQKKWEKAKEYFLHSGDVIGDIASEYINGKKILMEAITLPHLAYLTLKLLVEANMKRAFFILARKCRDSLAFFAGMNRILKESGKMREWLRELVEEDGEAAMKILAHVEDKEIIREFKDVLIKMAKEEIDEKQYNALIALRKIVEDEDVKKVFIALIDDWDKEVKILSCEALQGVKDDMLLERAKKALKFETNKYIAYLLEKIIAFNEGKNE